MVQSAIVYRLNWNATCCLCDRVATKLSKVLGNWNSRKMGVGTENGNLQKSLLFIGFFNSKVHRIV